MVLDYNMPEMNGVQTLHAMLRKPVFADRQSGLDPVYVCLSTEIGCIEGIQSEPFDLLVRSMATPDIETIRQKIKEKRRRLRSN